MRRNIVSGFTLVELLIVVAIIGVLSTIGVPTYRSMVQKAKKSEAKVALGGLYTAETAFQAEYGTYGSVLAKVGFDLEGATATRIYTVGFPNGTCSATAFFPAAGNILSQVYPGYFSGTTNADTLYLAGNQPTVCPVAVVSAGNFTAAAAGRIGNSTSVFDQWTMTQARVLANTVDGVVK